MIIRDIIKELEKLAPPPYQESYDNSGLLTGDASATCTGVLCTLDCIETVVDEAIERECNLIVAHHPILFGAIKKITPRSYVERTIIKAIKNDIAIYAIHTNLDNMRAGVNAMMAKKLAVRENSISILAPKTGLIGKLYTYVPVNEAEKVRDALFESGAGSIGKYEECSFSSAGMGSFKPLEGSNPAIGEAGGGRELVPEQKVEVVFPYHILGQVVKALHLAHPYEVPAYEVLQLQNAHQDIGSGMLAELPHTMNEQEFLRHLQKAFNLTLVRHTPLLNRPVRTVALCGGAGSFLTKAAIAAGADAYITADIKYHEFFDADNQILLADIGHWESEQFTADLLANFLQDKFPTFAVLKTRELTNPVHYFV